MEGSDRGRATLYIPYFLHISFKAATTCSHWGWAAGLAGLSITLLPLRTDSGTEFLPQVGLCPLLQHFSVKNERRAYSWKELFARPHPFTPAGRQGNLSQHNQPMLKTQKEILGWK